jgi:hypothetical protein
MFVSHVSQDRVKKTTKNKILQRENEKRRNKPTDSRWWFDSTRGQFLSASSGCLSQGCPKLFGGGGKMIALIFAMLAGVLFVGRREFSEILAGLIARFMGGAR